MIFIYNFQEVVTYCNVKHCTAVDCCCSFHGNYFILQNLHQKLKYMNEYVNLLLLINMFICQLRQQRPGAET